MYVLPKKINFKPTIAEEDFITAMALKIYNKGRDDRSYEEVHKNTRDGKILELALVRQGATLNPKEFDVTDIDSYGWDVLYMGLRTEVKRIKLHELTKWAVFPHSQIKTFVKSAKQNIVDIFVVGDYTEEVDGTYSVEWLLIAPADTFRAIISPASEEYDRNFDRNNELKWLYNHHSDERTVHRDFIEEDLYLDPNH